MQKDRVTHRDKEREKVGRSGGGRMDLNKSGGVGVSQKETDGEIIKKMLKRGRGGRGGVDTEKECTLERETDRERKRDKTYKDIKKDKHSQTKTQGKTAGRGSDGTTPQGGQTGTEGQHQTFGAESLVQITTQFGLQLLQTVTHVLHATHLQHTECWVTNQVPVSHVRCYMAQHDFFL